MNHVHGFKKGENTREKNHLWKGEDATYVVMHRWVQNNRGKATLCEHCKQTDKKRYEWANIDHKYKRNLSDYIQLCTACHVKYDRENGLRVFEKGYDVETAKELFSKGYSYRRIAREMGIGTHSTVKRLLS